ncbi:alpha-glucuronidase family glycosyl hydrolase [Salegentibacter salegens]|uniref:Xylan alpha-1,2-glucuronidase n=1 Tax=Salegentibacter salegens TaxID=143223 RepID=A0A1M7N5U0_9FLAO|nr:alpha-glucuronidase family glycosyl hydrolase [Salegentibacter salegens]PRX46870.1 alpha-glucuronidase [Salegentibacter salegens]SHM98830.1 alpha-glucuronidase [Salegentibacter salegens]
MKLKKFISLALLSLFVFNIQAQEGYELWLDYKKIQDTTVKKKYASFLNNIELIGNSSTIQAIKDELQLARTGFEFENSDPSGNSKLIIGIQSNLPSSLKSQIDTENLGNEGYTITSLNNKETIVISGNSDVALLYGTFGLLREMQQKNDISNLNIEEKPKIQKRVLNHWDNLDRTVERGYAGFSIWDWHLLPELIKPEYKDYARANAAIGINGTVLTNVNSNALILTPHYIEKVKALAEVFRPYGIQVYLTARFSAPIELGDLDTADPLDEDVKKWWKNIADEIYSEIPDFGGFLVKADSEGQPGPFQYDRTHVDGANMLAEAVAPYDGIIMWRAFVYSEEDPDDRAKQAYDQFIPYDGKFADNVLVQVKNGAIDFQPREPFHPMFGAMPDTPLMMEFQITQEYLGFSSHLVFLPKLYEEVLDEDTFSDGENSPVAKVIDGTNSNKKLTGIAGVANIGTEKNWTGHPFGQANWYGFGRLAWDPYMDSKDIAKEWLKINFSNEENFVKPMTDLLIESREAVVNYMTPLGLHHIMATSHHYGPGPWVDDLGRPEWNPVYYHKADKNGIGFDRTSSGSDALSQYAKPIEEKYSSPETTPEKYLLWFHHLAWEYEMKNGKTLWDNIALHYQTGVEQVEEMQATWEEMEPYVNEREFEKTSMLLEIQLKEAKWWRDACLSYFQQFSNMELPEGVPEPEHNLEYYKSIERPFAPGINPSW